MGDAALPYILPRVDDSRLETIKFANLLSALRARKQRSTRVNHRPIDATIDLTTTCQLRCPYCAVGNGTMARAVTLMKPNRYHHLLSNIGDEVFIIWYFSTGEPLLHKQFGSLVSTSKHQRIFSAISTNLSIPLPLEKIDQLILSGLGMISVSLDGASAETYGRYRVGGDFALVLDNLQTLICRKRELGVEFPLIEWRFLRFRHNQHEVEAARKMAAEFGVDLLEFFPGYAPPRATEDQVQSADSSLTGPAVQGPALHNGKVRGTLDAFLCKEPRAFGLPVASSDEKKCDWLYFGTMLYPGGSVGACCVLNDEKDDFSHMDDHADFKACWNSDKFNKARDLFSTGLMSGTACDRCPMPDAQTYQFGQKLRGILRIAPDWVLKVLDAAPDEFFLKIDHLLMPQEIGSIASGRLCNEQRHIRSNTYADVVRQFQCSTISSDQKQTIEALVAR